MTFTMGRRKILYTLFSLESTLLARDLYHMDLMSWMMMIARSIRAECHMLLP